MAIHRGVEKLCKDRNKLIDKHTVMFPTSVPLEEVSEYVLNYLEKRYSMDKKKLIVNSDGGDGKKFLGINFIKKFNLIYSVPTLRFL